MTNEDIIEITKEIIINIVKSSSRETRSKEHIGIISQNIFDLIQRHLDYEKGNYLFPELVLSVLIWYNSKSEEYRSLQLLTDCVKDFEKFYFSEEQTAKRRILNNKKENNMPKGIPPYNPESESEIKLKQLTYINESIPKILKGFELLGKITIGNHFSVGINRNTIRIENETYGSDHIVEEIGPTYFETDSQRLDLVYTWVLLLVKDIENRIRERVEELKSF